MKHLKFGQTPWDDLSREELLREVQRMYSAVMSANSALHLAGFEETSGFWGLGGTGGRAREKTRQVIDPRHAAYDRENIYRAFFRYADDLLFEGIGYGWVVCPKCGTMYGKQEPGEPGTLCRDMGFGPKNCDGVLHALTWEDLIPNGGAK